MVQRRSELDAAAMLVLLVLCANWGVQQVVIKLVNAGISPLMQAGLRSAGAALLLWAWSAWRGVRLFERDGSFGLGLLMAALFGFEFVLIFWGLTFTSASHGVLLFYTAPFTVALGAHWFLPGERLRPQQAIGLAFAFVGVAVAFADALSLPTGGELIGDAMALVAAVSWGASTVLVKATRLIGLSPHKVLFYQLAGSGVALPVLSAALGEPGVIRLGPMILLGLAYQATVIAFVTYLAWFWLVARYPASKVAAFSFLTPLFGVLAGGLLLDEPVTPALAAALLLVAGGIWLVNRPAPVAARAAPAPQG